MIRTMLGLAALLALPAVAQAQGIDVRVVTRSGLPDQDLPLSLANTPIGQAECRNADEIEIRLTNLPDTNRIDIWWGTNCSALERRGDSTKEGCEFIKNIELPTGAVSQRTLALNAREIVNAATGGNIGAETNNTDAGIGGPDAGIPSTGPCTGFSSQEQIFFLATDQAMSTAQVDNWGAVDAAIDTDAPDAPPNVSTGVGERQIPVTWDLPSSGGILRYRVYWDLDVGDDCSSERLVEGRPITNTGALQSEEVGTPTTDEITLTRPVPVGSQAALAVVSVDRAFNQSPASNVACLVSMDTNGFWDIYKGEGGSGQKGCSIGALTPQRGGVLSLLTLALGLLLLRRRRLG